MTGTLHAGGFVSETPTELLSHGDFNGDGREDQIIVDKGTGTYRIGYQLAVDNFTWTAPRGSGLTNLSSCTVGKLQPPSVGNVPRDSLAVTSVASNRIVLCPAENPAAASSPLDLLPQKIGTATVVALDVFGPASDPVYDDLLAVSWLNSSPAANQFEVIRGGAAHPAESPATAIFDAWGAGNAVKLKTTGEVLAGFVSRNDAVGRLRFYASATAVISQASNNLFVVEDAFWASGFFGGSTLATVLEYQRGTHDLNAHAVMEAGNFYTLQPAVSFTLAGTIDLVVVLEGPSDTRLLAILENHQAVQILDFDGVNAPVVAMTLYAPPGLEFTGANAVAGGHLQLFSGAIGTGKSSQFDFYKRSGATYTLQQTGNLAAPNLNTGRRSLLVFNDEPFVDPQAGLLASFPAGDWTSGIGQIFGNLVFTTEGYLSTSDGLGGASSVDLGAPPAGGTWALPNQYRSDVSIFNLQGNPVGVPSVTVSPPAGQYSRAVQLQFQATLPTDFVYYRTGSDQPWASTTGPGPMLTATSTLQFYAERGSVNSPIVSAGYRFPSPEKLDSDGDGVPDFVELERGLNPLGGSDSDADGTDDLTELLEGTNPLSAASPPRVDSDGDGFSDAQEIAAGTNPNDPTSVPPLRGGFWLEAVARLFSNGLPSGKWPGAGTLVTARMCDALPLATAACTDYLLANPQGARAYFPAINPALESPLVVLSTPSVFLSNGAPQVQGAELITVLPTPLNVVPVPINYVPGNGPANVESAAWIAAAQAARAASQWQPNAFTSLSPFDTLSALLIEMKLREIFQARSVANASRLTLFAFSPADERCIPLTAEQGSAPAALPLSAELLATVGQRQSSTLPGYNVRLLAQTIIDAIRFPANPQTVALNKLAADLYEKFEAQSLTLPNGEANPAALLYSPANMLRCFLAGNPLPADYLAVTGLTSAERTAAAATPALILAAVQPRATRTATLTVTASSFSGSQTLLNETSVPQVIGLVKDNGSAWRFSNGVPPATGSVVEVFGYTDAALPTGADAALEVIEATLTTMPGNSAGPDTDGDGLTDSWELVFFGSLSETSGGDFDHDGVPNGAEFLAGTDPSNGTSTPPLAPLARPLVPALEIAQPEAGVIMLGWNYPDTLAADVIFSIECSPGLGSSDFLPVAASIFQSQPGTWLARIVQTEPTRCFFRLRVTSK